VSSGINGVDKDEDDLPYFSIPGNQKFFDIASRVISEVTSRPGVLMDAYRFNLPSHGGRGTAARISFFRNGRSLFAVGAIPEMALLRDMPDDFGIIPFPKYNTDQPGYLTRVCGGFPFVIPVTNQRTEIAGALLEAMACETRNTVIPAYYESALKGKYSRDTDTAEMLDLIFDTRVYVLGDTIWCYPIRTDITTVFASGRDNFVSFIDRMTDRYNGLIQDTVNKFLGD
jgi:hypothetical protein